jgi:hypothetical protein
MRIIILCIYIVLYIIVYYITTMLYYIIKWLSFSCAELFKHYTMEACGGVDV